MLVEIHIYPGHVPVSTGMEDALKQTGSLAGLQSQHQNSGLSEGLTIEQGNSNREGSHRWGEA